MKLTKLIIIFVLACSLQLVACSRSFAAGEDIAVVGDTRAKTVSLDSVDISTLGSGAEGEIRYNSIDEELYVWDGTQWKPLSANRNVATKIIGVRRSPADPALDSLDADRADYICDGTDDQQEINQAILDIVYSATTPINKAKQGVVYLLDGTYNISDKISPDISYTRPDPGGSVTITTPGIILQSGISLIGAGAGTVLKVVASASFDVITASSFNRILISQLMVDGNKRTATNPLGVTGTNNGIYFAGVTYSKIDRVWVESLSAGYGIYLFTASNDNIISGNSVQGNDNHGIYLVSSSNNNILSGNSVQGNGASGIYLWPSSYNTLSGNNVQGNAQNGIYLRASSNNNILSGNSVQGNSNYGIFLWGSNNNILSGNNVQGNTQSGISFLTSSFNTLSGNSVQGNLQNGIYLASSPSNNIIGNVVSDNGNGYDAIYIISSSSSNLISSNYVYDEVGATKYGINISNSNCINNYLAGNYISGVFSTNNKKISDSGGSLGTDGTRYTGKEKITLEQASHQNPGSGNIITPGPASYIPLNPSSSYTLNTTTAIADGKADGDLLILENISTNTITIPNSANTKLGAARALGQYDNMVLIWKSDTDPAKSNWLELSYWDN